MPGAPFTLRRRGWAFSQASFEANLVLIRTALAAMGEPFPRRALELYAGSGNFTLPLASLSPEVIAVEGDPDAARELEDNLASAGRRAQVIAADVQEALGRVATADAVLLDPPRAGAAEAVPLLLSLRASPDRLVSCHPARARDLRATRRGRLSRGGRSRRSTPSPDLARGTVATCLRWT
jgi:23S rRNA (uracil1939-C5)-methyltransferase